MERDFPKIKAVREVLLYLLSDACCVSGSIVPLSLNRCSNFLFTPCPISVHGNRGKMSTEIVNVTTKAESRKIMD